MFLPDLYQGGCSTLDPRNRQIWAALARSVRGGGIGKGRGGGCFGTDIQSHDRITQTRDRDVRHQVADRVTHSEYRQAENGLGHTEDDSDGLEDSDNLLCDGRDPCYGDDEAEEAEKEMISGLGGW